MPITLCTWMAKTRAIPSLHRDILPAKVTGSWSDAASGNAYSLNRRAVSGNAVLRHKAKYQLFTRLILAVDSSNLRDNFVRNNTFLPSFPVPGHPYISKMLCAFTSIWNPETGTTTLTRTVGEISLSRFLPGYYCPDRLVMNSTAIAHRLRFDFV